jgi:hypothetical protein
MVMSLSGEEETAAWSTFTNVSEEFGFVVAPMVGASMAWHSPAIVSSERRSKAFTVNPHSTRQGGAAPTESIWWSEVYSSVADLSN